MRTFTTPSKTRDLLQAAKAVTPATLPSSQGPRHSEQQQKGLRVEPEIPRLAPASVWSLNPCVACNLTNPMAAGRGVGGSSGIHSPCCRFHKVLRPDAAEVCWPASLWWLTALVRGEDAL